VCWLPPHALPTYVRALGGLNDVIKLRSASKTATSPPVPPARPPKSPRPIILAPPADARRTPHSTPIPRPPREIPLSGPLPRLAPPIARSARRYAASQSVAQGLTDPTIVATAPNNASPARRPSLKGELIVPGAPRVKIILTTIDSAPS
jgi:hypothetical protein